MTFENNGSLQIKSERNKSQGFQRSGLKLSDRMLSLREQQKFSHYREKNQQNKLTELDSRSAFLSSLPSYNHHSENAGRTENC